MPTDTENVAEPRLHQRRAFAVSLVVFIAVAAILGRHVLRHPATTALHDAGDPLLSAAILHWTATHLPLTREWWQFPIYYPTPDVLAFSEHMLGLSVIATPLEWLTGNALVTYNIVALLTYPLCAAAMYALVWRLTRSAPAAFVAALAYGFAPYRVPQSPHVQMLAVFWAPLALLGLHGYIETRRRRWLALYGAAWLLQGASNGYYLFFFSIFVALWTLWFVVGRKDWRALWRIAVTTVLAALPLVPVLYGYLVVHARNGFVRSPQEIQLYSADVAGVFCASELLSFWSWLRVPAACRTPEGELFPGIALVATCAFAVVAAWRRADGTPAAEARRRVDILRWPLLVVGITYLAVAATVLVSGPWRVRLAGIRVSASSPQRPLLIAIAALAIAGALSPRLRRHVARGSALWFYLVAAAITWLFALGPDITVMGRAVGIPGPFALFMRLPGAASLRVPARFWGLTVLALCVVAGVGSAHLLNGRSRMLRRVAFTVLAIAILADGWIGAMPAVPVAPPPMPPAALAGRVVMQLPVGDVFDLPATYYAAIGGWRSINGYSGYHPNYYAALNYSVRFEEDSAFVPFQALTELDVLVPTRAPRLIALVERQPGVQVLARRGEWIHYRLPRRGRAEDGGGSGTRVAIASAQSSCAADKLPLAVDEDPKTRWVCGPATNEEVVELDLGMIVETGAVVNGIGRYHDQFPPELIVDTSTDRETWTPAWKGSLLAQTIKGGFDGPDLLRIVIPFDPRRARYIRLRHPAGRDYFWTIAELEVWSAR